jgi:hypothetical protein
MGKVKHGKVKLDDTRPTGATVMVVPVTLPGTPLITKQT